MLPLIFDENNIPLMLTQRKRLTIKTGIKLRILLPLLHQAQPNLLGFVHSNRKVIRTLKYLVTNLLTQFPERMIMLLPREIL